MTDQGPTSPTSGAFEPHSNSFRRARPPDINTTGHETRVPLRGDLRTEKLAKRESRVGLRSLFSRSKAAKNTKELEASPALQELSRPGGIRASLAEIGNWPYGLHAARSDISLPNMPPPSSARSTSSPLRSQPLSAPLRQQNAKGRSPPLEPTLSPRSAKEPTAIWTAPPLFQAYPQAVKHATLPACSVSIDALLRLQGSRNSVLMMDDLTTSSLNLNQEEDTDKKGEKPKKKHQRNGSKSALEWTTKIYALVTSGYLLQYASEGSFDRQPERILQLTKDSAAFASDLIPGKHWVLQVSSSMDADGTPAAASRSLFSKLSIRASEKRNASDFLMVFESADDMENWLATLRGEIEALGGRKKLSETGKPKTEDSIIPLRTQLSQRTLVVRDPDRFSHVITQDFSYTQRNALGDNLESPRATSTLESTPDLTLDDASTTASHYSSDGQHLDSLRDSGNRLSFISSGQRTILTSAGSSPACSPIRASFSSNGDEQKQQPSQISQPEVRLRPNAQAIASRRQSMQTMLPPFDRIDSSIHPHLSIAEGNEYVSNRQSIPNFSIPNFSIPHGANRRLSAMRTSAVENLHESPQAFAHHEAVVKPARKSPPTALAMSRPLSVVMDQPSPGSPSYSIEPMRSIDTTQNQAPVAEARETSSTVTSWIEDTPEPLSTHQELPSRNSSLIYRRQLTPTIQLSIKTSPERLSGADNVRIQRETSSIPRSDVHSFVLPNDTAPIRALSYRTPRIVEEMPRAASAMDRHGPERRLSTAPMANSSTYKRASFVAETSPFYTRHSYAHTTEMDAAIEEAMPRSLPRESSFLRAQAPLPAPTNHFLTIDHQAKALFNRRSMPQLVEGPPPVPPPTRALPPIPRKHQDALHAPPPSIRI